QTHVAAAVAVRWDDFARRHPALANVIDQTLIIENVADDIAADPAYQEAIAAVRATTVGIEAIVGLVDNGVVRFMQRLI
ncbi:MAG TPA: hypothetical protein VF595_06735, partial [Tepidisphaeraceae bacterium]